MEKASDLAIYLTVGKLETDYDFFNKATSPKTGPIANSM
jgi:hypothetical protein